MVPQAEIIDKRVNGLYVVHDVDEFVYLEKKIYVIKHDFYKLYYYYDLYWQNRYLN